MELKKSKEANIDQMRTPIVMIGLLFVGSLVLASFSYSEPSVDEKLADLSDKSANLKFVAAEKPKDTPPPVTPPSVTATPPPSDVIIEKKNTEKEPEVVIDVIPDIKIADEVIAPVTEEVIEFPDVEAAFPGGAAALNKWIQENVQYPPTSVEMNEQGRVYLSFVVERDGSVSNIVVERGVSADLDREAKRVVRSMPAWTPGEAKGKAAKTRCRLPINFTLN